MPPKPKQDPAPPPAKSAKAPKAKPVTAKAKPTPEVTRQAAPAAKPNKAAAPQADPTIPLTPASLAAYKALNAQYEATIQATDDVGVLKGLEASQLDVRNILTKDNMYRLKASTALYDALLTQINSTNKDLATLRKQIAAIAGDIATAATILAAIDTVLKVVPIP